MTKQHATLKTKQRGVAALLAILLIGLGLAAVTVGTIYSTHDIQRSNTALHKQAQAQAKAWQAMEVIRIALQSMSQSTLATLPTDEDLEITGLHHIEARVIANVASGSGRRITVRIVATGSDSNNASSTLEAIYQVLPGSGGGGGGSVSHVSGVNIKGRLTLTGHLRVLGGSNAVVNVDGTVDLSGTVLNIARLCATGDITIGSGITVDTVCTNGNLNINAGATVTTANVKGNVAVTGDGTVTTINSNGAVTLSGGSAKSTSITATGSVSVTGGSAYAVNIATEGNVTWTSSSNMSRTITANGDVTFAAKSASTNIFCGGNVTLNNQGHVNDITTLGNVKLQSGYGLGINGRLTGAGNLNYNANTLAMAGKVRGTITGPVVQSWNPSMNVTRDASLVVNFNRVTVPTIDNTFEPPPRVDAYALESSANYAFKVDSNGRKVVTVRGVSTIPNGTYFLADYVPNWSVPSSSPLYGQHVDYLCVELNSSGKCTQPANPTYAICQGFSSSNPCFSYNASSKTWTISGTTITTGVAWFEGSLVVSNGKYFNTFVATCNIDTGGEMRTYAPNYVGYAGICQNATANGRSSNALFSGNYPAMFCETAANPGALSGSYQPQPIGNIAFAAGSYTNGVFQCGRVGLGSSNEVWGSIVAGDNLSVSGSTIVHGQVYAAGQSGSASSTTGGGVTIDLRSLPPTFDPGLLPCTSNCSSGGGGTASARMFWSRYL